ncbi:ABC transporter substrate-binding protein [Secundilactobacillus kimchicus]|uniref:ABC transporter substrate-binding protein n=1 Tax=Secundilactobacillus kimchicus TaxID=528209 RepID=UPI0024A9DED8|nr:ABC transporter substrate-binding protein [Secundilactobacillus kimchicus]
MVHNQNVHIIENTRLSTVDISKVASFRMLTSSTEGLFRLGKNGHVALGLAESYKVSHAGTQYVFKLRPNARWSNSEPINAQDFVYSWRRTVTPSTHSVNANMFDGIKNAAAIREKRLPANQLGVKATAKKTLKITLDHLIYYFTRLLAYPYLRLSIKEWSPRMASNTDKVLLINCTAGRLSSSSGTIMRTVGP